MKTTNVFLPLKVLTGFSLLLVLGLASCEDDDDVIVIIDREEDAQELMAYILSYDTYGLVAHFDRIGEIVEEESDCGETTVNEDSESGSYNLYDYEYDLTETYTLNCEPILSVTYDLIGLQTIEAENFGALHEIVLAFTTTGLEESSMEEVYNGAYGRTGSWQSEVNDNGYSFEYDSSLTDVEVARETNQIQSGTGTFTLVQTYDADDTVYTYTGTLEFLNADEVEVTYDNGESYVVDISNVSIKD